MIMLWSFPYCHNTLHGFPKRETALTYWVSTWSTSLNSLKPHSYFSCRRKAAFSTGMQLEIQEESWYDESFSFLTTPFSKKENLSSFHVHRSNWEICIIKIMCSLRLASLQYYCMLIDAPEQDVKALYYCCLGTSQSAPMEVTLPILFISKFKRHIFQNQSQPRGSHPKAYL